jgi:hypothetical protein
MKIILSLIIGGALVVSGFGQTRNVLVGTNSAVVQPTNFWSADAVNARAGLGLGSAATNPATAFQPASANLTNLAANNGSGLTNLTASNITGTVGLASNVSGVVAITNGGSGATTAGGARTNLGLGETNDVTVNRIITTATGVSANPAIRVGTNANGLAATGSVLFLVGGGNSTVSVSSSTLAVNGDITVGNSGQTRTNLGLGWSALTNSNAGTGLVSVNTNGEVVSPTNFWQVAPINTTIQSFTNIVANETNNATNSRDLFVYSLNTSVTGITNIIVLPTNNTLSGDVATITHSGNSNSVTGVRQAGGSTNLITLNNLNQASKFIFRNSNWSIAPNPEDTVNTVKLRSPDNSIWTVTIDNNGVLTATK